MPTQKQRQERLEILAEKWKTNRENGCSDVLNRKLCDDMMKQVWFLGHQTREDYFRPAVITARSCLIGPNTGNNQ